jgi:hypothetical protein
MFVGHAIPVSVNLPQLACILVFTPHQHIEENRMMNALTWRLFQF